MILEGMVLLLLNLDGNGIFKILFFFNFKCGFLNWYCVNVFECFDNSLMFFLRYILMLFMNVEFNEFCFSKFLNIFLFFLINFFGCW